MHTSYGLCGVKKRKRIWIGWFNKANFREPCIADTMLISSWLNSKPVDLQEVHSVQWSLWLQNTWMWGQNMCMENTYYVRIPEWLRVRSRFRWLDHDIRIRARFYGVCIASDVVSRIVDTHWVTSVNAFPSYAHSIPFFICELAIWITIVVSLK